MVHWMHYYIVFIKSNKIIQTFLKQLVHKGSLARWIFKTALDTKHFVTLILLQNLITQYYVHQCPLSLLAWGRHFTEKLACLSDFMTLVIRAAIPNQFPILEDNLRFLSCAKAVHFHGNWLTLQDISKPILHSFLLINFISVHIWRDVNVRD